MNVPPNCIQDHSKCLNPCRSWGADPLKCLCRSLLAPPQNNDPGYATDYMDIHTEGGGGITKLLSDSTNQEGSFISNCMLEKNGK